MTFVSRLCAGADANLLQQGLILPVYIDFKKAPHLLVVAPSGGGKTYLLKYILQQLSLSILDGPDGLNGQLILADFKGIDFQFMKNCKNYYQHSLVGEALDRVFQELQNRMSKSPPNLSPFFFVVDEWSGYLGILNKQEQEKRKQQMASILMLGRGVSIFLIMALQRADASYISGRDNFGNRIGLGRLSSESIKMLFDDNETILPNQRGKGYLHTDGMTLREIIIPKLRDESHTMHIIYDGLNC